MSELNRREFLVLSAMTSAALLLKDNSWAASKPASYAAFEELPPGDIRPLGWLRLVLEQQAKKLGTNLPKVSWPFTEPYWKGETEGESWWPWEQTAYWIDGATRLSLVLDDKDLQRQVHETLDYTLSHIDPDGYIGPDYFKEPSGDFHRWPTMLFFRSLEATSDSEHAAGKSIVAAMHRHYLGDKADYGKATRNVTNIEPMLWTYERTGDRRLLEMAEKAWAVYQTVASDPEHGDLSKERVEANKPINAHGVTYQETAKQPAILYAHTGKKEYLDFAIKAQRRAIEHHMLVDGIPSTSEWYRGTGSLDSHETCCIADHTWSWGHLLIASGDGIWADRIERGVFNAGMGAIKKDWKAVQYFSCPNQVLATLNSDHNQMAYGGRMMAYQPNPGQHTACCGGNVHRVLPNYALRMWMKSRDGGLAATLYGPCKVSAQVDGVEIQIEEKTEYPFRETIEFEIATDRPVRFPLTLRIPVWCEAPSLSVNGADVPLRAKDGFARIDRIFKTGDRLVLKLPMRVQTTAWPDDGIAFEYGPLVFSLPIGEHWEPVVEERYTTADYPSWNATPTTPWNYAVSGVARMEETIGGMNPWTHPPIRLKVSAAKLAGWTLAENPKNPEQKFTPTLPDPAKRSPSDAEEIELAPLGSTHLRITTFPRV